MPRLVRDELLLTGIAGSGPRLRFEQRLGNQSADDTEVDADLAKTAYEFGEDGNQVRLNP